MYTLYNSSFSKDELHSRMQSMVQQIVTKKTTLINDVDNEDDENMCVIN